MPSGDDSESKWRTVSVFDEQHVIGGIDDRGGIQGSVGDRKLLQNSETEFADQKLLEHLPECGMDANLDSSYRHVADPLSPNEGALQLVLFQLDVLPTDEPVGLPRSMGLVKRPVRTSRRSRSANPIWFFLDLIWTDFGGVVWLNRKTTRFTQ